MTTAEVVKLVLARLEEADIPYMVVGSLANAVHGVPRTIQDADVVIAPFRRGLAACVGNTAAVVL